jgi:hypothetical protein
MRENFQIEYQKHYELFVTSHSYKKEHNMEYDESYSSLNASREDSVVIRQDEVTLQPLDDDANSEELSEPDSLETDVSKMRQSKNAEFVQMKIRKRLICVIQNLASREIIVELIKINHGFSGHVDKEPASNNGRGT